MTKYKDDDPSRFTKNRFDYDEFDELDDEFDQNEFDLDGFDDVQGIDDVDELDELAELDEIKENFQKHSPIARPSVAYSDDRAVATRDLVPAMPTHLTAPGVNLGAYINTVHQIPILTPAEKTACRAVLL